MIARIRPLSRLLTVTILAATVMQGCAYSPTGSGNGYSFTLMAGAQTLSLAQGGTTSTSIQLTRSAGTSNAIAVHVEGLPTGVTFDLTATTVVDSFVLHVTASETAELGDYQILVVATATGLATRSATITVHVARAGTIPVPNIADVTAGAHACALASTGAAFCWGANASGQLGAGGFFLQSTVPVQVAGGITFAALSVSRVSGTTCGLTGQGAAYCWGANALHQLGDGSTTPRPTPTPVAGGLAFRSIAVGTGSACAVELNGDLRCWGTSPNGALGDGDVELLPVPTLIAPGLRFASVVSGDEFSCALTNTGAAYCWGLGNQGQLGDGLTVNVRTPVLVAGGLRFSTLTAGTHTTCGLTDAGKAYCWGSNFFGTLGIGTSSTTGGPNRQLEPIEVGGGLAFRSISVGVETACGVTLANAGFCWGYNLGAVGDGSTDHRSTPTPVSGAIAFQQISVGFGFSCGLTMTHTLLCWGDNPNGQLGDGSTATRLAPTAVAAIMLTAPAATATTSNARRVLLRE